MTDPFDIHTHGRFYGATPCQPCEAKDAEIERLEEIADTNYVRYREQTNRIGELLARIEQLEDLIALNCDPCAATDEDAKVIAECYASFCEREDRE